MTNLIYIPTWRKILLNVAGKMREKDLIQRFRGNLLAWYGKTQRSFPWRDDPTPYKVWISEIMLQQTQAASVLPYYERFLNRFPDLASLARASVPELLELWSGLGYYSRAKNLQRAAIQMLETHKCFPKEFAQIIALPGIGRYTAGAICSIAYGQPYPVVDGNVRRVIARLHAMESKIPDSYFWETMSNWVPAGNASQFNQAMMELGALICVPAKPQCAKCPVQFFCKAKKLHIENRVPIIPKRRPSVRIRIAVLVLEHRNRILLSAVAKRTLIPGAWGLPWREVPEGESPDEIASGLFEKISGHAGRLRPCSKVTHAITNHRISAFGFHADTEMRTVKVLDGFRWAEPSSLKSLLTSSLFFKILREKD